MNPDRVVSNIEKRNANKDIPVWNKGLTADVDDRVRKRIVKQKENYRRNPSSYKYGHPQDLATREKIRKYAIKNGLGGFNMRRGISYNGIKLDSSYELEVAKELDNNNVLWKRCSRFPYTWTDGGTHYYTPDFYLPEYDVYLDPKNDFLIEYINPGTGINDVDKIRAVENQNNIRVIILDRNHLTWNSIKELIQDD